MTLVVARKIANSVFVLSDTKLTLEATKEKISATDGVIKTKLVSDSLAISFAGNEYIADKAIREIRPANSTEAVVRILLDAHRSAHRDFNADFIVTRADPEPRILVIKDDDVTATDAGWIGSARGFQRFREYEIGDRKPSLRRGNTADISIIQIPERQGRAATGHETYVRMLTSMVHLVEDSDVPEVDGLAIPVATTGSVFWSSPGFVDSYGLTDSSRSWALLS